MQLGQVLPWTLGEYLVCLMPPPGSPWTGGVKVGAQGDSMSGVVGTRPSGTPALPLLHFLLPDGLSQTLSWSFPTAFSGPGQVLRLDKDAPDMALDRLVEGLTPILALSQT